MRTIKKIIENKEKFKLQHSKIFLKKFLLKFLKKLPMILILLLFYTYINSLDENKIPLEQYQSTILPEIHSFENNINLNPNIFAEFRRINSENKLIEENQKFKKSYYPDISIIMTMYNQAHCIHKGLRSIQNQSINNIEIIIIDDCSEDNSTEVIKEYQKEDPRIILIAHDTNEGEMKSRVDGIRKAKGKYITIVDGDDALIHKDILKNSLFIIQKGKLDIVEFGGIEYRNGNYFQKIYDYHKFNISNIIYQPELRTKFMIEINDRKDYVLLNRAIWGKLIKNKLFQKILKYMGPEYTEDYINEAEDTFMAISVSHLAKSYYIMKEFGYYYSKDEKKNKFPKMENKVCKVNNKIKGFGWYKYYKFLVDKKSKDDKEKNMIINEMKFGDPRKGLTMKLDDKHYQILFYTYDKMLEWNCWNKEQRNYIIEQKNKVIKKYNDSMN